jgi:hypothetical protein
MTEQLVEYQSRLSLAAFLANFFSFLRRLKNADNNWLHVSSMTPEHVSI